jgi:alpha-ketoglutarate-dependent sulfate ester dioxygenase
MSNATPHHAGLTIKPVAGHIGAEISGVDLKQHVSDAQIAAIRAALLRHKVVFFRGQHIDHAQQIAFTGRFGEVTYAHPHEDAPPEGFEKILPIDRSRYESRNGIRRSSYDNRWHTDVTAAINPPAGSILRAVDVPEVGGDTQWTNLVAAYESLSAPLRALADGLRAEHRFNARLNLPRTHAYQRRIEANPLVSIHPVVRVHPETGERALFVNPGFTSHIVDVGRHESDKLLEIFFDAVTNPTFTTRFRWNNGDIAFWDNRATAHLAPSDTDHIDVPRVLYRTTITGDIPVGVDGRASEIVEGEFFGNKVPTALPKVAEISEEVAQARNVAKAGRTAETVPA